ncbi:MAG TPA: glycosyltransferase family 87 protein [Candidatus Acidoferrum sp.]|nr:glycosyltransferase family 87 protein [Candidatus Acidoferrum sp.]
MLPLLIGFEIFVWVVYIPIGLSGFADFRTLYASGYMVRTHHGHDIYDTEKLMSLKEQLAPIGHIFNQPMDHPAYEALLFFPLSLLPYRAAFVAFIVFNLAAVVVCVRLLKSNFAVLSESWSLFPAFLFAVFFPITRTIVEGQDSILLLALLAGALLCTQKGKDVEAGILTGLGLFKLQIVLPIALLFFLWRRWRFVFGFGASSGAMVIVTWLMVGVSGLRQYAAILLGMSFRLVSEADAMRYSLSPRTMLNLRGLLSAALEGRISHWALQSLIVLSSAIVLVIAARRRPSLPLAITAAALVSYHLNAQDASILIVPIGLCLCGDSVWTALAAVAALIVPISAIVPLYGYLGSVPFLALFVAVCRSQQVGGIYLPGFGCETKKA